MLEAKHKESGGIEFDKQLTDIGLTPKKNQSIYFKLIDEFLNGNEQFLIARGGMGLGKSLATIVAIKSSYRMFSKFYLSTPFAKIKDEWARDLNRFKIKYAMWLSKKGCIVPTFHTSEEDCDDDCEHRKYLETNNEYTPLCESLFEELQPIYPLTASEYYSKKGENHCLWPITKYGLKTEKILIGDYFPFLNPAMIGNMAFDDYSSPEGSVLVVDEAHKLPDRIKDHFSKEVGLDFLIKALEEECHEIIGNEKLFASLNNKLKLLKKGAKKMKQDLGDKGVYKEDIFKGEFGFNELLKDVVRLENITFKKKEFKEEKKNASTRMRELLLEWQKRYGDDKYLCYLNTKKYYNKQYLCVNIKVLDITEITPRLFNRWKKVIFISGTIDERFKTQMGLPITVSEKIDSFDLSKNVIIYGKGDFTSKARTETLNSLTEEFKTLIRKMKGRIIIFVPSIEMSNHVQACLETRRPVYDVCKNRGQDIKTKTLNEFAQSKEGICLYGIRQGIEGQNLTSEDKNGVTSAVENCIVLGYPFMQKGEEYTANKTYYTKKYGSVGTANKLCEYYPIGQNLHQALARTKRNANDEPCCVLIGMQYLHPNLNLCLPLDLRRNVTDNFNELINFIGSVNEKRA